MGKTAHFAAEVSDQDGDFVDRYWAATGGRLSAEADGGEPDTFTCLLPGVQTLTLWYSDSRGCGDSASTDVECVARSDDAGG